MELRAVSHDQLALSALAQETSVKLSYNASWPYLKRCVEEWGKTGLNGWKLNLHKAAVGEDAFGSRTSNVTSWRYDPKTVEVWDITVTTPGERGHACVAVYIPDTTLRILDPRSGGAHANTRIIGLALRTACTNNPGSMICTEYDLPERGLGIGRDVDANGLCMLWCCLFFTTEMLGIEWADVSALRADKLENALKGADYVPERINLRLTELPRRVLRKVAIGGGCAPTRVSWVLSHNDAQPPTPVRPGMLKSLYDPAIKIDNVLLTIDDKFVGYPVPAEERLTSIKAQHGGRVKAAFIDKSKRTRLSTWPPEWPELHFCVQYLGYTAKGFVDM